MRLTMQDDQLTLGPLFILFHLFFEALLVSIMPSPHGLFLECLEGVSICAQSQQESRSAWYL